MRLTLRSSCVRFHPTETDTEICRRSYLNKELNRGWPSAMECRLSGLSRKSVPGLLLEKELLAIARIPIGLLSLELKGAAL